MRVLGSLGTKTALSTLEKMNLPAPDAPSDFNERRLAALQALQEWPQRSADVTSVLERAMDRAEVGPERARAVETYIHLLFVQGNTPTEAHMVKQLLYILENNDSDLHRARKEFIGSLSRLQDRELALKTAEQLLKSTLLPPTSKEDAAKEFAEMTPTDSR